MQPIHTLVITGTSGADTTAALALLGDMGPLARLRQFLPAMLDHTPCELDEGETVHLFGVPPSQCGEFVQIAKPLGLVVLVDGSRPDPILDVLACLDACSGRQALPIVSVGVYGTSDESLATHRSFRAALASRHVSGSVLAVDLHRRGDLLMLLDSILSHASRRQRAAWA